VRLSRMPFKIGQNVIYLNTNTLPFPNEEFATKRPARIVSITNKNRYNIHLKNKNRTLNNVHEINLRSVGGKHRKPRSKTRKLRR